MKIAIISRAYPTHRPGGMLFCCQDRAEELARQGHEVHVVTTGVFGYGGVKLDALNGVYLHYTYSPPCEWSAEFAIAAERSVRGIEPDVVHFESFDRQRPWHVNLPNDIRKVVTMHGFGMGAFLTDWNLHRIGQADSPTFPAAKIMAEAKALATFDRVIAISRHERTLLEDCYGLPNVRLVYNPIAPCFFDKVQVEPPAKRRFLCAAISGQSERQFGLAQEAAKMAGVELVTVNDVPRHEMPAVYDSVSAVVVPTCYAQGYDLTIAEAFARGRPAIVSATGSYLREERHRSEQRLDGFEDQFPAVVVPLGDATALATAMNRPLPKVWSDESAKHFPSVHVENWLKAVAA
jgi:glycosyltransferase involved in cell wall biosynthesis